jgi:hypothetical protein
MTRRVLKHGNPKSLAIGGYERRNEDKKHIVLSVVSGVFILGAGSAHANPIVIEPDLYGVSGNIHLFGLIAWSALLMEYLVTRRLLSPQAGIRHVLPAFLVIHLITFPITTLLGRGFAWFAEIFPLAVEPSMYRYYLRKVGVEL